MTPPELDDRTVGQLLRSYLPLEPGRRLVLVHGRYASAARATFTVEIDGTARAVTVQDQQSVLGVLGAWQEHRESGAEGSLLVVTTGVPDRKLGWDLRGHALRRGTLTVDRAEIVAQRFGAAEVEPRVRREPWLLDALLAAEPPQGWARSGPVLTYVAAVRALVATRFGLAEAVPDAGALLEWSQTSGPDRFVALPDAEQEGLGEWLTETVGPFAALFTGLVRAGRAADVLPLGVLVSLIDEPGVPAQTTMAVGSLLSDVRSDARTRGAFVTAVLGTLERWISHAESGGAGGGEARDRVLEVLNRADAIAADRGIEAGDHPFLPSGFRRRLDAVATALTPEPDDTTVSVALGALDRLREHRVARLHPERVAAATMSVRLLRWLAIPDSPQDSVGHAVTAQLRIGGWVDRALTVVWAGENSATASVGHAFGRIHDAARARRDDLDERFAARLRTWTEHAAATAPGGAMVVENALDAVAAPLLTGDTAPLIIVVDGMSAAVATELGEQILDRGWTEVSRDGAGREAAVAVVPSVTRASRTSLLTGKAATGDQTTERDGFTALWKRHGRGADLLHKADIAGAAGRRLSERLVGGLADPSTVVGVVLNTVDDALDHGREGDRTGWRLHDITYLPDLLDAARSYGRPVMVVSDHGHVLERSTESEKSAKQAPSARWRTGTPGEGEVELVGPRVLEGDGRVVVPWKEGIRYANRRAGYHGGASLAEMTVPVLVFVPAGEHVPMGFSVLASEATRPAWWNGRGAPIVSSVSVDKPSTPSRRRPKKQLDDAQPMFEDMPVVVPAKPAVAAAVTLGARVVKTATFKAQHATVRRAHEPAKVAALLDALNDAGGELTATAAVAELGRAGREPGPVLAHLQRLLNLEGYPVIAFDGRTVRLDVDVLSIQFGLDRT
ncbi:PglZ domain-containing protein [Pseudonocardia sediminis]|uniref:PglZ domain-containing protein n=1 Tax=Pseudonocardia sediminis TaxID=1397368 RepID=A0A4Q7UYL5_PSEST|nr:BREX-2 system phosphatase PglZ [Pseudonocardia sediminis]RZT87172.1 PglZ domain-containing protein [Pseudonocardia sediminis]